MTRPIQILAGVTLRRRDGVPDLPRGLRRRRAPKDRQSATLAFDPKG